MSIRERDAEWGADEWAQGRPFWAEADRHTILAAGDALAEALRQIDALPAGHYRRNGFASPDPWVRQRDVRHIAQQALARWKEATDA